MHPELQAHPAYFQKEIVKLSDNVYQAFGFAASNVYMIIGDDGVIIIDTSESTSAAENILAGFREITSLPIKHVIFTHSHRDHVSGASVFVANDNPVIHASTRYSDDSLFVASSHPQPVKAMQVRTKRQFGIGLSYPDEIIGIGIGPGDRPLKGLGQGSVAPTRFIEDEGETITLCGVELQLVLAPGETPDHIVVWYEDKKILISGDNFYRSFPNLYAIRGTAYRDFDAWADSLDLLMAFDAEILGPGHTKALFGKQTIQSSLTDYRDAIRHVVDETRKGMDEGKTIDELAHLVRLPDHLAEKPHLREYYGRVDHAVRAYFVGTMGWFDGNPTSLSRLSPKEEAHNIIRLAGGAEAVLSEIHNAIEAQSYQWALELLDRLLAAEPLQSDAIKLKSQILIAAAEDEINCPTRHYYIQCAKELSE